MKLIGCHIENFGCLCNFDMSFQDEITVIDRENGWGKSTLATFIRVMFYGFDNETKKAVAERERYQKAPWQKGVYGGNLIFQKDGRTYRLERTFDEKKAAKDTFALYDVNTNLESHDYTENIGEELFDIDSESFERTVFIAQQDCASHITDQISAKIGNLSEETADMGNFEEVTGKIRDEMNRLTEKRVTGLGRKLKDEIASLKTEIAQKDYYSTQLAETKKELEEKRHVCEEISEKLTETEDEIRTETAVNQQLSLAGLYDQMHKDLENISTDLTQAQSLFPSDIPTVEEMNRQMENARYYESEKIKKESYTFTGKEELTLQQFETVFHEGIPTDELISVISSNVAEYELLKKNRSENQMSDTEMQEYRSGKDRFENTGLKQEDMNTMIQKWKKSESTAVKSSENRKILKYLPSIVLLIVAMAVPVISGMKMAGILVGLFLGIIAIILLFLPGKGNRKDVSSDSKVIPDERRSVHEFLKKYGMDTQDEEVLFSLYELKRRYENWLKLQKRYEENRKSEMNGRQEKLGRKLDSFFFSYYGKGDNYPARLEKLQNDIREYDALLEKKNRLTAARQAMENCRTRYEQFCRVLGFSAENDMVLHISRIRDGLVRYMEVRRNYLQKKGQIEEFEKSHDMEKLRQVTATDHEIDLAELHDRQSCLQKEKESLKDSIVQTTARLNSFSDELDHIEEVEREKEDLQVKYEETTHRFAVLDETLKKLSEARNSFNARYLAPIQKSFDYYYGLLCGNDGKQYELDANLNIVLKAYGKGRDVSLMSEGYQDLIGLCRRMAMIDAMYEKEKPFIILDDPFVNLDEKKLQGAVSFIKEISQNYQIIYMTCHSCRNI